MSLGDVERIFVSGGLYAPAEMMSQGADVSEGFACCAEISGIEYPFERRPSEADIDYAARLYPRYMELRRLGDLDFPATTLANMDPVVMAEVVALYHAVCLDVGVPREGFTLPARTDDEYIALCTVLGVGPQDWLVADPWNAEDDDLAYGLRVLGNGDSMNDNYGVSTDASGNLTYDFRLFLPAHAGQPGPYHAAAVFPGPDGALYRRLNFGVGTAFNVAGSYPAPSEFMNNGTDLLRDLFWKLYWQVGTRIEAEGGPDLNRWIDPADGGTLESIDILWPVPPEAAQFEPVQIAQLNGIPAIRGLGRPITRGVIGRNLAAGRVAFRLARVRAQAQTNRGDYTRDQLREGMLQIGRSEGITSMQQLRQIARTDPARFNNIANRARASARLRNPANQQRLQGARRRSEDDIERVGGTINHEVHSPNVGGQIIPNRPDGFTNPIRGTDGQVTRAQVTHEGKDTAIVSLTRQLRGEIQTASDLQGTIRLHIRPGAHVTQNAKDAVRLSGGSITPFGSDTPIKLTR